MLRASITRTVQTSMLALLLTGNVRLMADDTFVLVDGQALEGTVLRTTGSRITLKTKTGVQTYDVMEFHEDTRTEHFEEIEAERVRRILQVKQAAEEARTTRASTGQTSGTPEAPAPFRATRLLIGAAAGLMLIGSIWLLVQAFAVSPLWGIAMLLFNGIAGFFFLGAHPERAKGPILTWVAGVILLILGLVSNR